MGGPGGIWTFTLSGAPLSVPYASLESVIEPEGSVDQARYGLTKKHLINTIRDAIRRRGAYIYSRQRKCEIPKRELWDWLKFLAPEDVNEISPGIYRLQKRKGSKGYKDKPAPTTEGTGAA
jgi:hypothetical protein